MPIPPAMLAKIRDTLDTTFDQYGHTATVTLYPEGEVFDVKITEGFRSSANMTSGMQQEVHRVKIYKPHWDAVASRPPQKGDMLEFRGEKRRVQQRQRTRGLGDVDLLYVLEMKG